MSNERPDAQAVIQNLSSRAAKPTAKAMKLIKHLVGYLWGTQGYGVNLCLAPGKSVMNFARGKLTPDEPITEHICKQAASGYSSGWQPKRYVWRRCRPSSTRVTWSRKACSSGG